MKSIVKRFLSSLGMGESSLYWLLQKREWLRYVFVNLVGAQEREHTICGYRVLFRASGNATRFGAFHMSGGSPRLNAFCPHCGLLDRHQLLFLMDREHQILGHAGDLLHIAPERALTKSFRARFPGYPSDYLYIPDVDRIESIESLSLPDNSFDTVFCSKVLEHVDDRKALVEMHRVLLTGGILVAMVPVSEAWDTTYENPAITEMLARDLHFGQHDHARCFRN